MLTTLQNTTPRLTCAGVHPEGALGFAVPLWMFHRAANSRLRTQYTTRLLYARNTAVVGDRG